jgi:hydrogenase/urease accessory protein HupE
MRWLGTGGDLCYSTPMRWNFPHAIALLVACGLISAGTMARAHQPGLSTLYVDLGTNQLSARLILAWQELDTIVPLDSNQDRALSEAELAAAKAKLSRLAEGALDMVSDGRMLALKKPPEVVRDDADNTGIRFHLVYEFPPTRVLTVTSEIIAELQRGHSQVLSIRSSNGVELGTAVLDNDKPTVDIPLFALKEKPRFGSKMSAARHFLVMGIEHLVTGWDHLAFLFGLLVVGGTLRDAVKIITSFTIAHSLALALATLDLIRIPPSIVEPLIAISVIYVGFENIVRDNFRKRWILTFAFGLIHGCGFASVLRDLGVGRDGSSVVTPLVWFNIGVEVGQLVIAAVMLPLIWKLKPTFPKRWVPATSVALIVLGSYFLVQRVWPGTQ